MSVLSNEFFQGDQKNKKKKSGAITAIRTLIDQFPDHDKAPQLSDIQTAVNILSSTKNSPWRGDEEGARNLFKEHVGNVSWQIHVVGDEQIEFGSESSSDDDDVDAVKARMKAKQAISEATASPKRK